MPPYRISIYLNVAKSMRENYSAKKVHFSMRNGSAGRRFQGQQCSCVLSWLLDSSTYLPNGLLVSHKRLLATSDVKVKHHIKDSKWSFTGGKFHPQNYIVFRGSGISGNTQKWQFGRSITGSRLFFQPKAVRFPRGVAAVDQYARLDVNERFTQPSRQASFHGSTRQASCSWTFHSSSSHSSFLYDTSVSTLWICIIHPPGTCS